MEGNALPLDVVASRLRDDRARARHHAVVVNLELRFNGDGPSDEDVLWCVEREVIKRAMLASNGNITHAAARLGIERQSLQRKLRRLALR